jgi:ribose 5-phosphate isomerase RpiB
MLKKANRKRARFVDANNPDAFIAAAKTRQWDREKSVRTETFLAARFSGTERHRRRLAKVAELEN